MKTFTMLSRYAMALFLLAFGANKFLGFIPNPELSGTAGDFMGGLVGSGYFMPMVGVIMLLTGLSLLMNKYTALMLAVMAPITANIVLFHLFLAPEGLAIGGFLFLLHVVMIAEYRKAYQALACPCSGGACSVKKKK